MQQSNHSHQLKPLLEAGHVEHTRTTICEEVFHGCVEVIQAVVCVGLHVPATSAAKTGTRSLWARNCGTQTSALARAFPCSSNAGAKRNISTKSFDPSKFPRETASPSAESNWDLLLW